MNTTIRRFGVRHMMMVVAAAALAILPIKCVVYTYRYSPHAGYALNGGLLKPGQKCLVIGDFPAAPVDQSLPKNGGGYDRLPIARGRLNVVEGTTCIVTIEPAWDDDECSKDRPIGVLLSDGKHQGTAVAIPREFLRGLFR